MKGRWLVALILSLFLWCFLWCAVSLVGGWSIIISLSSAYLLDLWIVFIVPSNLYRGSWLERDSAS
jgi:hypothetical protein